MGMHQPPAHPAAVVADGQTGVPKCLRRQSRAAGVVSMSPHICASLSPEPTASARVIPTVEGAFPTLGRLRPQDRRAGRRRTQTRLLNFGGRTVQ